MKKLLSVLTFILAGLIFMSAHDTLAQKKMKKEVLWPTENIKWEAMKDAPPGTMGAALWGDMAKGAYGVLVKFPANTKHPLHTHANDIKAVIISGTFTYAPDGGEEKSYGAGSYLFIPANVKHTSGSGPDGCTFFMEQPGKFDMKMTEMKKGEMK